MLKASNLTIKSNTRTVIDDVSLEVAEGQIVALLGPNGAGKSELVLCLAGVMPLASGAFAVDETFLNGKGIQTIRAAGVATVPEGHQVLGGLSVLDNLKAAGHTLDPRTRATAVENAFVIFPELVKIKNQAAGSLSGGQQQMVAIAQALVSKPRFLLIDEMSLGLAPVIIDRLIDVIRDLRTKGIGILLIEQFTQLALDVADYCYVLSQGKLRFEGHPEQLKNDRTILEQAYLGV
ncbi:ATP-binding cassette domain-containing protein [Lentibacter algarum]|uniref:ABC transporter ATP-binding protein n=1 Tax=Lentibacter algarum TaxID=576131 RepID=UPI001C077180|nr:ATP-binding cassette domain-containing protein [Lentibacter algarum]MBU2981035.1 ATP-binding cassette domain-containing protein [Lentibacter algarum]